MPALTLYVADNSEPVAWRAVRIAGVVQRAEKMASKMDAVWNGALIELADVEGDLIAVWKDHDSRTLFAGVIDAAWADVGEINNSVDHRVATSNGSVD